MPEVKIEVVDRPSEQESHLPRACHVSVERGHGGEYATVALHTDHGVQVFKGLVSVAALQALASFCPLVMDQTVASFWRKLMKDRMLQFFGYEHLPEHLQAVSKPFAELANRVVDTLPSNPERTVALRKLLEAKDCAVRALLYKDS